MARRRRGRRGGGKSKSLPILALLPVMPAVARVAREGVSKATPEVAIFELSGYSASAGQWNTAVLGRQVGLAIAGVVGHKIANRTVNKYIPKWLMVKL